MDLKMIKKHNKNITDVLKIVYPDISHYRIDTLKEFGYIQNVNEIFFPKKCIVKGYNRIVEEYNYQILEINSAKSIITSTNANIDAYQKRLAKLKIEQQKLLTMCQKVDKPDNFDYCMYLLDRKSTLIAQLHSKKQVVSYEMRHEQEMEEVTHTSTSFLSGGPIYSSSSEKVPTGTMKHKLEPIVEWIPDDNAKQTAENELQYIESEISKQGNFEYNVSLRRLYNSYDKLTQSINTLSNIIITEKEKVKAKEETVDKFMQTAKQFDEILKEEIKEIVAKYNITKLGLKRKDTIDTGINYELEDKDVCYRLEEDYHVFGRNYSSLKYWKSVVNEQIEQFGVDYVEMSDLTSEVNDVKYYDYPELEDEYLGFY